MATNTPLQSVLITSSTSTIVFSNIDQNYTDLVLVVSAKVDTGLDIWIRCNGDSASNYGYTLLTGNGTTVSSIRDPNVTQGLLSDWDGVPKPTFGHVLTFTLNNYSNATTYKTSLARSNRADSGLDIVTSTWRNTNAITNLTLRASNGSRTFDAGTTVDLYGIKSGAQKAYGGDVVTTDGNYWYHAFRNSGTFIPQYPISCDVLVVAGGGGGGGQLDSGNTSGGGGAGGYLAYTSQSVSTEQTITVGAGGNGGSFGANNGSQGSNSQFGSLTASVGGGFGQRGFAGGYGGTGGSGGGTSGSATSGQGNAGGAGAANYQGGGGGGAGAAGSGAGNGGAGLNTLTSWFSATGTGSSGYVAGGGGGGQYFYADGTRLGGSGGGGNGGGWNGSSLVAPVAGTANTGGGGGGAGSRDGQGAKAGANGGSGLIIVRYAV